MNTIRSVWYGWGVLIVAGGGAYYFAKKSINADRAERAATDRQRKAYLQRQEHDTQLASPSKSPTSSRSKSSDPQPPAAGSIAASAENAWRKGDVEGSGGGNPSIEASEDPAPTRHAPISEGQRTQEKSKYEATEPFRSKKGDRFSGL